MIKPAVYLIAVMLCVISGAFDIWVAINSFNEQKYGKFGVYIMLTIWIVTLLIKTLFEYT